MAAEPAIVEVATGFIEAAGRRTIVRPVAAYCSEQWASTTEAASPASTAT